MVEARRKAFLKVVTARTGCYATQQKLSGKVTGIFGTLPNTRF